jgi:hypothetical protein
MTALKGLQNLKVLAIFSKLTGTKKTLLKNPEIMIIRLTFMIHGLKCEWTF